MVAFSFSLASRCMGVITLIFIPLGFYWLLEHVNICLSPNLENSQQLFLWVSFLLHFPSPLFLGLQLPIRLLVINPSVLEVLFLSRIFSLSTSDFLQATKTLLISSQSLFFIFIILDAFVLIYHAFTNLSFYHLHSAITSIQLIFYFRYYLF